MDLVNSHLFPSMVMTLGQCFPENLFARFNSILYPTLLYYNSVLQANDKSSVKKLRTKYMSFPVAPKAKESHFKIFNGIYPSSEFLRQRFNFEENTCTFS